MKNDVFEGKTGIEEVLGRIAGDVEKGAGELAVESLEVFRKAKPLPELAPDLYRNAVLSLSRRVSELRPVMASLLGSASRVAFEFNEASKLLDDCEKMYETLQRSVETVAAELLSAPTLTAGHFAKMFPNINSPVIISYSSTVVSVFKTLRRPWRISVCESRPVLEGRKTAKLLLDHAESVSLITEAQILSAVRDADSVVLGCDAVCSDGCIINKTGSGLLAMAARSEGKPVIVVGDSFKFCSVEALALEEHSPGEVWQEAPSMIHINNCYFEKIPSSRIDFIAVETGVYPTGKIESLWNAIASKRIF